MGGTGGRGKGQSIPAPPRGSIFTPEEFGSPGGRDDDDHSLPVGKGGGIVAMSAPAIEINGALLVDGTSPSHASIGGGSGGSILLSADVFRGHGKLSANGGAASTQQTNYPGGGGGAGRIALHYGQKTFAGEVSCHGGNSLYEAGGPGTVVLHDTGNDTVSLSVDNNNAKNPTVDTIVNYLPGIPGSQSSGVAWILPEVDGREFQFEVLSLSGGSHLAVVLESDSDSATLDVKHSKGDQTGTFHVGPHQVQVL